MREALIVLLVLILIFAAVLALRWWATHAEFLDVEENPWH